MQTCNQLAVNYFQALYVCLCKGQAAMTDISSCSASCGRSLLVNFQECSECGSDFSETEWETLVTDLP